MGHSKKIWDASGYDRTNGQQYRDAKEILDKILEDQLGEVDVILDIGCGSGNSTKMLSSCVPHKKMYACDFDDQMVSYANEKYNDGTIEYFVQDIGLPWEKLDERLRKLEGKVDLVWSNRCLHWVEDKATAAKTIGRLMKPEGRCYINTTLIRDINEFATEEEKQENLKYLKIQSHQDQLDEWTHVFNNCGLKTVNIEMLFKGWLYDAEEEFSQMEGGSLVPFVSRLMRENVSEDKRNELLNVLSPKYIKMVGTKYGSNYKDLEEDYDVRQTYYEQFRIIGTK